MSEVVEEEDERGRGGLSALLRRIKEETQFRLERFTMDDTRQLVSLLLEDARQTASTQGGDISPFDEDTIRLIHNRANGVPGYVIDQCRRVLEEADRQHESITQAKAALWLGLTVEEITMGQEVVEEADVIDEEL
jgi:type II secretory pathway predicted ATPase ExeA